MRTNQKLKLSKGPSSYPKSENMLEFSNLGHTFYTWRIDCAKKIMKKSKLVMYAGSKVGFGSGSGITSRVRVGSGL